METMRFLQLAEPYPMRAWSAYNVPVESLGESHPFTQEVKDAFANNRDNVLTLPAHEKGLYPLIPGEVNISIRPGNPPQLHFLHRER